MSLFDLFRKPAVRGLAQAPETLGADAEPLLPRIDLTLDIPGATRSVMMFTLQYRLTIANRTPRAANDLSLAVQHPHGLALSTTHRRLDDYASPYSPTARIDPQGHLAQRTDVPARQIRQPPRRGTPPASPAMLPLTAVGWRSYKK